MPKVHISLRSTESEARFDIKQPKSKKSRHPKEFSMQGEMIHSESTKAYRAVSLVSQSIDFTSIPIKRKVLSQEEVTFLWNTLIGKLRFKSKVSLLNNYHWTLYVLWKRNITRGINKIAQRRRIIKNAAIKIQKTHKMFEKRKRYMRMKVACKKIQYYWKNAWKQRKTFLTIKKLVRYLKAFAK